MTDGRRAKIDLTFFLILLFVFSISLMLFINHRPPTRLDLDTQRDILTEAGHHGGPCLVDRAGPFLAFDRMWFTAGGGLMRYEACHIDN